MLSIIAVVHTLSGSTFDVCKLRCLWTQSGTRTSDQVNFLLITTTLTGCWWDEVTVWSSVISLLLVSSVQSLEVSSSKW